MIASPRSIAVAMRVYGVALLCYPRALRARYGDDMRNTFASQCDDAAAGGAAGVWILLLRELADLACASIAARRRGS